MLALDASKVCYGCSSEGRGGSSGTESHELDAVQHRCGTGHHVVEVQLMAVEVHHDQSIRPFDDVRDEPAGSVRKPEPAVTGRRYSDEPTDTGAAPRRTVTSSPPNWPLSTVTSK